MKTVLLAGGTGGAKLAAGLQAEISSDLTVIVGAGGCPAIALATTSKSSASTSPPTPTWSPTG